MSLPWKNQFPVKNKSQKAIWLPKLVWCNTWSPFVLLGHGKSTCGKHIMTWSLCTMSLVELDYIYELFKLFYDMLSLLQKCYDCLQYNKKLWSTNGKSDQQQICDAHSYSWDVSVGDCMYVLFDWDLTSGPVNYVIRL